MNSSKTLNNSAFSRTGILFVLSAPSGAGKSTLCSNLRQAPDFVYSVSCTTRPPRPGEIDGEDYFFLSREAFARRVARGDFLEHAEVHGNFYGTPRDTVAGHLARGVDVLLDVDVEGAAQIRANADPFIRDALADVFMMPPNIDELRRRLIRRGTESEEQITTRLANAEKEMQSWRDYKYTLVSGSMEEDLQKFRAIMRAERYLTRRLRHNPVTPDQPRLL